MKEPGSGLEDLFARLGEAQDRALTAAPIMPSELAAGVVPRSMARRRWIAWISFAAVAAAAGAIVLVVRPRTAIAPTVATTATTTTTLTATGRDGAVPAQTALAAGNSELPLRFSNGSTAIFHPGSTGRLLRLHETGAEVELIAGRVEASIFHGVDTRWVFRAGPFAVRVTGTRFDVEWSPQARKLVVSLRQGGVTVDGAVLGAGVPLRAGQRLAVTLNRDDTGSVRTEALDEPLTQVAEASRADESPTMRHEGHDAWGAAGFAGRGSSRGARDPLRVPNSNLGAVGFAGRGPSRGARDPLRVPNSNDWMRLADRGAQAEAWQAARRIGVDDLRRRLDPVQLLALADVARYVGARAEARSIFLTLVRRFPRHRLASDAVFSLGRLAFEAGDPATATAWFGRYQDQWPTGALASEATGRLIEAAVARHDDEDARKVAQSYLDRAPAGPYAALARQVLASPTKPSGEPPDDTTAAGVGSRR
jgi:transmembrane sensor